MYLAYIVDSNNIDLFGVDDGIKINTRRYHFLDKSYFE